MKQSLRLGLKNNKFYEVITFYNLKLNENMIHFCHVRF